MPRVNQQKRVFLHTHCWTLVQISLLVFLKLKGVEMAFIPKAVKHAIKLLTTPKTLKLVTQFSPQVLRDSLVIE